MKKINIFLILLLVLSCLSQNILAKTKNDDYIKELKRNLLVIFLAYPEQVLDLEKDKNDCIYLIMKNNKKILYDDKAIKSFDEKFYKGDIEDALNEPYPLEMINKVMDENIDPGRIRDYKFLGAMYGENRTEIEKNIKPTSTACGYAMFNSVNNANEALKNALNDISNIAKEKPEILAFVSPLSGGYNFRYIQDTGILSPHAYGISIDLNRNDSDYWKWVPKEKGSARISIYPKEIVETFENHGFVWGGKWSHFDILHFEYRPEIILKAKYFDNCNNEDDNWYGNIQLDENIKNIIELIEEKLNF